MVALRRQFVWFLLVLSLLFNLFFAAGYLQAKRQADLAGAEPAADPVNTNIAELLDLDAEQRETLAELRSSFAQDAAVFDGAIDDLRSEILEEVGRDAPDLDKFRSLLRQMAELRAERHRAGATRFSEFVGMLSPEQCRRLEAQTVRHAGGPDGPRRGGRRGGGPGDSGGHGGKVRDGGIPPELLRRFDQNGDGVIDDDERRALMEAHREERERRERLWRERVEQYDADGDGRLNHDEWEAFREANRRKRGDEDCDD